MNKLIYDIGMHTGRDTQFYLEKGFDVIAIEANPSLAAQSTRKFERYIETGQLRIVNMAIAEQSADKVEFFVNSAKDDWGTLLPSWNRSLNNSYSKIEVQSVCLDELLEKYGVPYYMKIDIEGADIMCLRSLMRCKNTPDYISVELLTPNNLGNSDVDSLEILVCLRAMGYTRFQISDQSKLRNVSCPNPAREGNYVDYKFDGHCSGLFGRELAEPTYRIDEIARMYLEYFYDAGTKSPINILRNILRTSPFHRTGWFDVHARK